MRLLSLLTLAWLLSASGSAQGMPATEFRPRFTSGLDPFEGSCKLRVRIDEEAEVVMRGDIVSIRTSSGNPGRDEGSECTAPLPSHGILEFDLRKTDGRGSAEVLERPDRRSNAQLVVRVRDPKRGEDKYTLEFQWATRSGIGSSIGRRRDSGGSSGTFPPGDAISLCQDVVRGRIAEHHGYTDIQFLRSTAVVGRREWFAGEATARRGNSQATFVFECNVSLDAGRVLEARVNRR